jgi:hypothetical protein
MRSAQLNLCLASTVETRDSFELGNSAASRDQPRHGLTASHLLKIRPENLPGQKNCSPQRDRRSATFVTTSPSIDADGRGIRPASVQSGNNKMRKTILTIFGVSLMAASSMQIATAAEHHHARKIYRAPASDSFRNANDSLASPAQSNWNPDYTDGHALSAPAGRN